MRSFLAFLSLAVLTSAKKKCPGHFSGATKNLCEGHFPDASSDKVWLVKFYAPWCGHCKAMQPDFQALGNELKSDEGIGIGGVDCTADSNQGLCGKYGVQGYPTIKSIVNGKAKAYNGPREKEPMKQYILDVKGKKGSKGGSNKCKPGLFKSKIKDGIIPLCQKHFPDAKSKHPWVIGFYNQDNFKDSDLFNRMAVEFGNEPPEKNKTRKSVLKQSERLDKLVEKYSVKDALTEGKRKSKDALAKFGAVCCDCDDESKKFCETHGFSGEPKFTVLKPKGVKTTDWTEGFNDDKVVAHVLRELDFSKPGKEEL